MHLQLKWDYLEKLPKYLWINFPISNVIPAAEFCGKHMYASPTLGDPPFHLRTSYCNFCSIPKHHPGQREHGGKDHGAPPKRLGLIHAALKVMKERYKTWHLTVQGERTGTGQLAVAQVLEKMAKLWRRSVSPSWGLCSRSVWKRWGPQGGPVLGWEEG